MRKIAISAIIELPDSPLDNVVDVDRTVISALLEKMGAKSYSFLADISVSEYTKAELKSEAIWLYMPGEDEIAYIVSGPGEVECDKQLDENGYIALRESGVCTEFHAVFPRADKYGMPGYTDEDVFAEGVVSEYGFSVPKDGLRISAKDRGDDGCAEFWLKIVVMESN
jgi:hypothetical protein